MDPRISIVILRVRRVCQARQPYGEGLGCPGDQDHGQACVLQTGRWFLHRARGITQT